MTLSKADYDLINLGTCIKGQADRLGIAHEGVPLEGVVVRIAEAALSRAAAPEPEWEYGYTSKWGICRRGNSLGVAKRDAADLRRGISEGRESGDLDYHGTLVRRARFAPGPWEPLPVGGESDE